MNKSDKVDLGESLAIAGAVFCSGGLARRKFSLIISGIAGLAAGINLMHKYR